MKLLSLIFFSQAIIATSHATSHLDFPPFPDKCPPSPISLRLTPLLNATNPRGWLEAPLYFNLGTWWFTHSTQTEFQALANAQVENAPVIAANTTQRHQITSIQLPINSTSTSTSNSQNNTVFTVHAIDTPFASDKNCFHSAGTGLLAATMVDYCFMAWGHDTRGEPFILEFSVEAPEAPGEDAEMSLNLLSRSAEGPTKETFEGLVEALKRSGNKEVEALAPMLKKLPNDGRRKGMPPAACGKACVQNSDVAGLE